MDTKGGEGKGDTLIPKDPRIFGTAPLQKHKNSVSNALCLKHLKLRFLKTKALPKLDKSVINHAGPSLIFLFFFFDTFPF